MVTEGQRCRENNTTVCWASVEAKPQLLVEGAGNVCVCVEFVFFCHWDHPPIITALEYKIRVGLETKP